MIKENGDEGGVVSVKPKLAVHTNYKAFYSENNSATHQRDSLRTEPLNTNELGARLANELAEGKAESTDKKQANGLHDGNKEPGASKDGENPLAAGDNSTAMPKTLKPSIFYREREHQDATATIKGPKTIGSTPIIPDLARHHQEYAGQLADEEKKMPEGERKGLAHQRAHLHDPVGGSTGNIEQMAQRKSPAFNEHPFRHLIFNPHTDEISFRKHLVMTYKGLLYATKCLKGPSDKFIKAKQVDLQIPPNNVRPKTLVLDLDETMSHTCSVKDRPDLVLYTNDDEGNSVSIPLKIRPYLNEFLKSMSRLYEIIVFTAGADYYANAIINYLDPTKELISDMLTRQNCMETKNGFVIKDLRIIRNRELKNIVMVDNLAHSFGLQIDNGIPILEYIDNPYDKELKYLAEFLTHLAEVDDVRGHIKEKIRLRELAVVDEERLFDFKKDS